MSDVKPVTHRRVLKIAGPIILSNATVPILGAVDTAVVGQIPSPEPIAAVGVGAIVIAAIYWIFGFLRMGTAGLTAQAAGAGDKAEVAALLTRAVMIGLAGGLVLIVLQPLIFAGAFRVSPASAEVEALAGQYMQIRIWSAPAAIALFGITGWLVGQERTGSVFVLQLWTNGINVLLSVTFVLGFGWGVPGVAIATLIAELTGVALGLLICRDALSRPEAFDWPRIFDMPKLRHMAAVNSDILLRSMLLQAIFVSFLLMGGRFGDVTLAANQVLLQFLEITAYALDGFAFAAEALVGQAMGARLPSHLRRSVQITCQWGFGFCCALALVFAALGPWLITVMTKSTEVQLAAHEFLPWMIAAPIIGCAAWMLDGVFIGATRTADMRNMMVLSFVVYVAALWLALPRLENHGLWLALQVSFLARGLTLAWRYPALERAATPV